MPRLKPSATELNRRAFLGALRANMTLVHGSDQWYHLSPLLGIGKSAVYTRIRKGDFTKAELEKVFDRYKFTDAQILASFGRGEQ